MSVEEFFKHDMFVDLEMTSISAIFIYCNVGRFLLCL